MYKFTKYYPWCYREFPSKVDNIKFYKWETCIEKYQKEFPLDNDYKYAYHRIEEKYILEKFMLMKVKNDGTDWHIVGFTNYPLDKKYSNWKDLVKRD